MNKINYKLMVAKVKSNALYSDIKITYKEGKPELQEFFNMLETYNDVFNICKANELIISQYGRSYLYFDIHTLPSGKRIVKIGMYEYDINNNAVRVGGLDEFAIVGKRVITNTPNGLQAAVLEIRTATEKQQRALTGGIEKLKSVPIESFQIDLPKIIKNYDYGVKQKINYNNVLSAMEFLNFNIITFNNEQNFNVLPDDSSVGYLLDTLDDYLMWVDKELKIDITRFFGNFNFQDYTDPAILANAKREVFNAEKGGLLPIGSADIMKATIDTSAISTSRTFINTVGSSNKVEVSHSNLKMKEIMDGYNSILENYYNGCGLDYNLAQGSNTNQKTTSEVKTNNQRTYETIKTANDWRTKQYEKFIERIMSAYGLNPANYKKDWSFDIISNILEDSELDKDNIIKLYDSGLISKKEAIKRANPHMTKWDLETMMSEIEEEAEEKKEQMLTMEPQKNNML